MIRRAKKELTPIIGAVALSELSVTAIWKVPALALTVSLPALKLTDANMKRSSRASTNALRSNTCARLRRPLFPAWRRRDGFKDANQDASRMGRFLWG